jgi:hypothetical protein
MVIMPNSWKASLFYMLSNITIFSKQDDIKKTRSYDMNKHLTSLSFTILALLASGWFFIVASDASKKISIAIKYYFLYG